MKFAVLVLGLFGSISVHANTNTCYESMSKDRVGSGTFVAPCVMVEDEPVRFSAEMSGDLICNTYGYERVVDSAYEGRFWPKTFEVTAFQDEEGKISLYYSKGNIDDRNSYALRYIKCSNY
jgi:hypothetical protein